VVDKRMPFMAFLKFVRAWARWMCAARITSRRACSPDHKAAIENPIVECVQADVSDDEYLERVFGTSKSSSSRTTL